jgi:hypothetical protein
MVEKGQSRTVSPTHYKNLTKQGPSLHTPDKKEQITKDRQDI